MTAIARLSRAIVGVMKREQLPAKTTLGNARRIYKEAVLDSPAKKCMSLEEFKRKRFEPLEDYLKEKKAEYPHLTEETLKQRHEKICGILYRTYKLACENPGNNVGLMLSQDFFEDDPR